jgi:SAM-dependent methyltransferase
VARAEALPFADGSFDLVSSSNVLEHAADRWGMVGELVRVCRPGGHVFLSWTNWLSPFGGHEWSPFHYLGPRLGPRAYRWLRGRPPPTTPPGRNLFVVHVGEVLRALGRTDLQIVDVAPRYWPRLAFLARIPGVREVALWNCAILIRRPPEGPGVLLGSGGGDRRWPGGASPPGR